MEVRELCQTALVPCRQGERTVRIAAAPFTPHLSRPTCGHRPAFPELATNNASALPFGADLWRHARIRGQGEAYMSAEFNPKMARVVLSSAKKGDFTALRAAIDPTPALRRLERTRRGRHLPSRRRWRTSTITMTTSTGARRRCMPPLTPIRRRWQKCCWPMAPM